MTDRYAALIARLEGATGPDRELDAAIYNVSKDAAIWDRIAVRLPMEKWQGRFDDGWHVVRREKAENDPYPEGLPSYTNTVGSALLLMPPSCDWLIGRGRTRPDEPLYGVQIFPADSGRMVETPPPLAIAEHDTLAIAVTLASLRARAAQEQDSP